MATVVFNLERNSLLQKNNSLSQNHLILQLDHAELMNDFVITVPLLQFKDK